MILLADLREMLSFWLVLYYSNVTILLDDVILEIVIDVMLEKCYHCR